MNKAAKTVLLASAALALSAVHAAAQTAVATANVNVRSGPGIQYPVIGGLAAGQATNLGACTAAWCQAAGGWVSRSYLGIGGVTAAPVAYTQEIVTVEQPRTRVVYTQRAQQVVTVPATTQVVTAPATTQVVTRPAWPQIFRPAQRVVTTQVVTVPAQQVVTVPATTQIVTVPATEYVTVPAQQFVTVPAAQQPVPGTQVAASPITVAPATVQVAVAP
jgi:uncharacterized protein YraI